MMFKWLRSIFRKSKSKSKIDESTRGSKHKDSTKSWKNPATTTQTKSKEEEPKVIITPTKTFYVTKKADPFGPMTVDRKMSTIYE